MTHNTALLKYWTGYIPTTHVIDAYGHGLLVRSVDDSFIEYMNGHMSKINLTRSIDQRRHCFQRV